VNNPIRFHDGAVHAVIVLSVGMLGFLTSACDDYPNGVSLVNSASSLSPAATFSPNPLRLGPFGGPCPGGFAFDNSFHVILTAGAHSLTLDGVALHMIDGSNLGGPSVMIPSPELATLSGSLFIHAGTTRAFALRPAFGCTTIRPRLLRGNAFVFDDLGTRQTIPLEGRIQ
jgi:hypothetical protein